MNKHATNLRRWSLFCITQIAFLLGAAFPSTSFSRQDHSGKLDEFLSRGKLVEAETYFSEIIGRNNNDHQARAALGFTQFLQALEGLGQANFRYAIVGRTAQNLPLARMPVPENENPEQVSYEDLRKVAENFNQRLGAAEATLAGVDTTNLKLMVYVGRVQLDLDGNGTLADDETLWKIFSNVNNAVDREQGRAFAIGFDGADVHWLRGYMHFLAAICDAALAYDERDLFERCGHMMFAKIDSPFETGRNQPGVPGDLDTRMIADLVAAIHLMHFKLVDAEKMASAHRHLLAMIAESRLSWERALAEKDDDNEWLPNPTQTGVLRIPVTREAIDGWHSVLDELEQILDGKKLIPYWREYYRNIFGQAEIPEHGVGINLKKVFLEPRDFDLILMIQGTDAEPFLENGPLSTPENWDRLARVFRGEFFGFAMWFN